ncbi:SHOCT domain-containing protein [Agreia sp.]
MARLERLAALHQSGALTDDEFTALKSSAIASL